MGELIIREDADIWENKSGMLLIPVNCVGVMGCGLAKECRRRYPHVYRDYSKRCKEGSFNVNTLKLYLLSDDLGILLIPTKSDWRNPSEIGWVEDNLRKLGDCLIRTPLTTLHVPPIGCGAGGLQISAVRPLVEQYLCKPNVTVNFYQPYGN